jgi:hypothetical protein
LDLYLRWQDRRSSGRLLCVAPRQGYLIGERLEAQLMGLDGNQIGRGRFLIQEMTGGGFAGQVYRAHLEELSPAAGARGRFPSSVALKLLKPVRVWKRVFRDLLFLFGYQTTFAARLREPAVRAGLIWQQLLRIAAGTELGDPSAVARPLGYYWSAEMKSFVELHAWVPGREISYQAGDLAWGTQAQNDTEMARKKRFMEALAALCREMGAIGLSRQYEWYTMVSQDNVIVHEQSLGGEVKYVGVDFRPGLAVPFFLPLSPAHLKLILNGLRRGTLIHYDEVDLHRLDRFISRHAEAYRPYQELIRLLKRDEAVYRAGLLDVWHTGFSTLTGRRKLAPVATAALQDWRQLDQISQGTHNRLRSTGTQMVFLYLLGWIPLVGWRLRRLLGNSRYRRHLRDWIADRSYFREHFQERKSGRLLYWSEMGRISLTRFERLVHSDALYVFDLLALSWMPASFHRLLSDGSALKGLLASLTTHPIRLLLDPGYRRGWLLEIIHQQEDRGILQVEERAHFEAQIAEGRVQGFVRDLGFTVGLEVLAKPLYALLAAYGFSSGNFLPFFLAALGPIPPSGVARTLYVLVQLCLDLPGTLRRGDRDLLLARALALGVAPWRVLGNVFALVEMFAYYPRLSLVLADYYIARMIAVIPVLGGRGLLLEYLAFRVIFGLPLYLSQMLPGHPVGEKV